MAHHGFDSIGKSQAIVASYPPLGMVTKLVTTKVNFSCVLLVKQECENEDWQVMIRYAPIGSDEWREDNLKHSQDDSFKPQVQQDSGKTQLLFHINIEITCAVRFLLRYRQGPEQLWLPARENLESELDNIVIPALENQHPKKSLDINDYMKDLNQDLRIRLLDDGSNCNTVSWIVEAPVEAASGENPYMTQVMLGKPFGGEILRWFGISRNTTSWMAPRQGRGYFKLDVAAILCSFINANGDHLIVFGISGFENVMTIFGDNNEGAMMIKIRNERDAPGFGRVIVAIGTGFEVTLVRTLDQVRHIFSSRKGPKRYLKDDSHILVEKYWANKWINGLIYSPKDHQKKPEEIVESLNSLSAKGIIVSGLILGSFWQNIDKNRPSQYYAGLVDFEADPVIFKSGLKHAVSEIKSKHKSVMNIIVKHPIFGYWGGISASPQGYINQTYETVHVRRSEAIQPGPKTEIILSLVSSQDVQRFFNDYYKFLSSCDISTVQAEGFYMLETLTSTIDRCSLAEKYLDAQSAASLENFPEGTMTSMSLSPSALLNCLKSPHIGRQIVRNVGAIPEPGRYVFNNASNALLSSNIGNIPDWGSVQSTKDNGAFHLAARTISGGPIQIASFDNSEIVDLELIQQISGSTATGKTVVLRPTGIGRTINPYVSFEDNILLQVANTHNIGSATVSIIGVFNVSNHEIFDLIKFDNFLSIDSNKEYVMRSSSCAISGHMSTNDRSLISLNLKALSYEFLSAYPLTALTGAQYEDTIYVATFGLQGKMLGASTVIDSTYGIEDGFLCLKAVTKILGVLEFYISNLARLNINVETCKIKIQDRHVVPSAATIHVADQVLALDLISIWEQNMIESGKDEIYVEVKLTGF